MILFICLLFRNRINLLKKEEEKAKKRINETKEKALDIVNLRDENEKKFQQSIILNEKSIYTTKSMAESNKNKANNIHKSMIQKSEELIQTRIKNANKIKQEKEVLSQRIIQEQQQDLIKKKLIRDNIIKQQETARIKRDLEKKIQENKRIQYYKTKIEKQEKDAIEAEAQVYKLERKESEYIHKLHNTQLIQNEILTKIENLLISPTNMSTSSHSR